MPAKSSAVTRLEEHPFFNRLEAVTRDRIAPLLQAREFARRQIVYFPNEACDYVYWVVRGRVRVVRMGPENREINVDIVTAGGMFGESALEEAWQAGEFAETVEPSVLFMMRSADFRKVCRAYPDMAVAVAAEILEKLQRAWSAMAETAFWSVKRRLAAALERFMDSGNQMVSMTHLDLARTVVAARETVTAHLRELEQDGILKLEHRRIWIQDPERLHRIAAGAQP